MSAERGAEQICKLYIVQNICVRHTHGYIVIVIYVCDTAETSNFFVNNYVLLLCHYKHWSGVS